MTFFLSIGLLVDLRFLWNNISLVLLLWAFVTIFKTALNTMIFRAMGESWQHAFLSSLFLAQIGEFGFVLLSLATSSYILPDAIAELLLLSVALSMLVTPLFTERAKSRSSLKSPDSPGSKARATISS